jgi:ABC-type nitrate/sulfonate/bicarbonate transport system substrate-binding protein
MGTTPYQDSLIMAVGQKFGWYKQACLNVTFTNTAWENAMSTLASGSVNVSWYNTTGVISTYHTDPKLVYVYPWDIFDQGAAMMVRPGLHLKTYDQLLASGLSQRAAVAQVVKELKGKQVIVSVGGDTGADLDTFLRSNSKLASWVHVINLGQNPGLAAFLRGTGDVYIGGIPQRETLVNDHYQTLIEGSAVTPAPLNGFVTTRAFYDANKDAFLALMHVMFMEIRYTQTHRQQVGAFVSKIYSQQTGSTLTAANFVTFFQHWEHYPLNAGQAQKQIFSTSGIGSWKAIWNNDNYYLFKVQHAIPAAVPYSAFLGVQFQKNYIAKYGANETGWWTAAKL